MNPVFFLLVMCFFACGGQRSSTNHGSSSASSASGSASGNSSGTAGAGSTYGGSGIATGASGNTNGNVTSPGVTAVLGTPCAPPGALACAGHAQKVTLVCGASAWNYA